MSEVVPEFLAAARTFRAALVADGVEDGAFARHVRDALARVYLAAALLGPPGAVEGDVGADDEDDPVLPREESDPLREKL